MGGVTLNTGNLLVQDDAALGTGTATLDGGVLIADAAGLTLGNDIVLGSATLDTQANTLTLAGDISGAGSLSKFGTGVLDLNGTNSFSGGSFINVGEVFVGASGALGTGVAIFADGTVLGASANAVLGNDIQLAGITVVHSGAGTLTLDGSVGGAGSISKVDAGTLVLNGLNSFASLAVIIGVVQAGHASALGTGGVVLVDGATLRAGADGLTIANTIDLTGTGGVVDTASFALTLDGAVSGMRLTKAGAGSVTLNAANSYTGGTQVNAGTIVFGNDAAFRTGAITIDGGNLVNTGVQTLANAIVLNSDLTLILPAALTLDGVISGVGNLTRADGTLSLNGVNTHSGGVQILNGVVEAGTDAAFGSGIVTLDIGTISNVSGATRSFANAINLIQNGSGVAGSSDIVLNGVVSGSGGFDKSGNNRLTLASANTYTGGTSLLGGRIILGTETSLSGGALTTSAGTAVQFGITAGNFNVVNDIVLDGATLFDALGTSFSVDVLTGIAGTNGSEVVLTGDISGTGALSLATFADVTFGGSNGFSGGLSFATGVVRVTSNASLGTGVVAMGGAAALRNDSGVALTLANAITGGTGASIGGSSDLTLTGGVTAGNNFRKLGSGVLTLQNVNAVTDFEVRGGTLVLAGSLTDTGLEVFSGATLAGSGSYAGTLTVDNGGHFAPGNSAGTFTTSALILNATSNLDFELATPGTVGSGVSDLIIVNNNLTLDGMLNIAALPGFTVGTYRIINYGGVLSDNVLEIGSVPVGFDTVNFTISTATAGQVNLILVLGSTVYWDGANMAGDGSVDGDSGTWGSGTGIFQTVGGTVAVASAHAFDLLQFVATDYLLIDGGGSLNLNGGSAIETQAGVTTTINAAITGANSITKTGAGTLVLGGANTFAGGISIVEGMLQVTSATALGSGSFDVGVGTTVVLDTGFANGVVIAGQAGTGGTFVAGTADATLSGAISGTGSLTKTGAFDLLLSNAGNSYEGGTNVEASFVRFSDSDAFGTGAITISDGAGIGTGVDVLTIANTIGLTGQASIDTSQLTLLSGAISGAGTLVKTGSGVLLLFNAANSYSGGTSITEGTIAISSDAALGNAAGGIDFTGANLKALTIAMDIDIARSIVFNDDATIFVLSDATLSGAISGDSRLTVQAGGVLTLSGTNSYTGGTAINGGIVSIASDGNLGGATGDVRLGLTGSSSGTLRLTGDVTSARAVTLAQTSTIDTVGTSVGSFAGSFTGTTLLSKTGTGTLALSGDTSGFTGGILLAGGTLSLLGNSAIDIETTGSVIDYADGVTSSVAINVNSNDTALQVSGLAVATQSGVMSETGGPRPLSKIGTGQLNLTAANSFTGLFSIGAGTIGIGNDTALGLGTVALADATALRALAAGFTLANDLVLTGTVTVETNGFGVLPANGLTLDGVVSGAGTLNKSGSGNLILGGVNSYAGGTLIDGGSVSISADANLGDAAGSVTFQSTANAALSTTGDFYQRTRYRLYQRLRRDRQQSRQRYRAERRDVGHRATGQVGRGLDDADQYRQ